MHRRLRLACLLAFVLSAARPAPIGAEMPPRPHDESLDALCTARALLAGGSHCAALGPAENAARWAALGLTTPLPALPTRPVAPAPPLSFRYARVNVAGAPVYGSEAEARMGGIPVRHLPSGFVYVSLGAREAASAGDVVQINPGEYVLAADLTPVTPSTFQGLAFSRTPARPVAWVLKPFRLRRTPGGDDDASMPSLRRYDVVQIFDVQSVGEWEWYMVGPDQWIEQRHVGKVDPLRDPPPPARGKWVTVNLYEQTLAAYEDGELVYATLVSTGLNRWATQTGSFAVYVRLGSEYMSGAEEPDRSDYYSLENVPWTMYFDGGRALHGAYWHDGFGRKRSHGCVNLAPADAYWLFQWAEVGTTVHVFDSRQ